VPEFAATDWLRREHEAILRDLERLESLVARIEQGEHIAAAELTDLVALLREYAERRHHRKEEDLLFPLLAQRGVPSPHGPLDVMLSEHRAGRALTDRMAEAALAYAAGEAGVLRAFCEEARCFVDLLRAHIHKEDRVLFAMADRLLEPADQARLRERFEALDRSLDAAGGSRPPQ
jgi:hemerythrin-like domain-containing protein